MSVRARTYDAVRTARPAAARRQLPPARGAAASGTEVKAWTAAATVGGHWGVVAIAVVASIWFVLAMLFLYATGVAGHDYLLWIVAGFALVFFALTLGLARW